MNRLYHKDDIIRTFNWLGHIRYGYTELLAVHRSFKPGKDNFKKNLDHGRLPKIWYTKNPQQACYFVSKYCIDHTCYFGVNPRPGILKNNRGSVRSAKEEDVRVLTCFYLDIDCKDKHPTDEHLAEIDLFIAKTERFFDEIRINPPAKSFSGRGFHLFFSPSPMLVSEHPDIKEKLHAFKAQFEDAFRKDIEQLGIAIDSTLDLRRMVKIPGTKKADPSITRISRFYGGERIDDKALRDYLICLEISESKKPSINMQISDSLPIKFLKLLESNQLMQDLWNGTGKTDGDLSSSGYDFSIVKYCLKKGITDVSDLASILAKRPNGAFQKRNKGRDYIKRTISKAIMSC